MCIRDSLLGEAIKNCVQPPSLWLNASSQAIYPPSKNATTENSTHFAKDFLATVTQQWEQTFFDYKNPKTRQIALRIAIVLGKDGGAFPLVSYTHLDVYKRQVLFGAKLATCQVHMVLLFSPEAKHNH